MTSSILLLAGALVVMTLAADFLVRSASSLALRAGIPPLFVGLTIVGFGTSSPELVASIAATLRGASVVSVTNVVGSNIFNVGVIVGLTALIRPIAVHFASLRRDLLVATAACFVPCVALLDGGLVTRPVGVVLVLALAAYLVWTFRASRREGSAEVDLAATEVRSTFAIVSERSGSIREIAADVVRLVASLALLILAARFLVDAAVDLARTLGMTERTIGLTIVSAGTSAPELVTSVLAARRGNSDIALGNVVGSTIFNLLGILGIAAIVGPQIVGPGVLRVDVPVMIGLTLALYPIMKTGWTISRVEGALLLAAFAVYLGFLLIG